VPLDGYFAFKLIQDSRTIGLFQLDSVSSPGVLSASRYAAAPSLASSGGLGRREGRRRRTDGESVRMCADDRQVRLGLYSSAGNVASKVPNTSPGW
jgi:hypothetical protein